MPGLIQEIKLRLNKQSAQQVQQEIFDTLAKGTYPDAVKKNLAEVDRGLGGLVESAKKLAASLGIAFGIEKIAEFGRASLEAYDQLRGAQARLDATLADMGVNVASVSDELDKVLARVKKLSGATDTDVRVVFGTLIDQTHSYATALKALPVVADVAAGKQLSLRNAAELVGRALAGNVTELQRYGIRIEQGDDVLAVLGARFRGQAEAAAAARGSLKNLGDGWDDLKTQIGRLLTDTGIASFFDKMGAAADGAADKLKGLNDEIERQAKLGQGEAGRQNAIAAVQPIASDASHTTLRRPPGFRGQPVLTTPGVRPGGTGAQPIVPLTLPVAPTAPAAPPLLNLQDLDRQIALYTQAIQFTATYHAGLTGLTEAEAKLRGELDRTDITFERRVGLETRLQAIEQSIQQVLDAADQRYAKRLQILISLATTEDARLTRIRELRAAEATLTSQIKQTNAESDRRLRLEEELRRVQAARKSVESTLFAGVEAQANRALGLSDQTPDEQAKRLGLPTSADMAKLAQQLHAEFTQAWVDNQFDIARIANPESMFAQMFDDIEAMAQDAGAGVASAFIDNFAAIIRGTEDVGTAVANMLKGFGKAVVGEIALEAKGKTVENAAYAIEELAKGLAASAIGNAAGASAHFAAAKTFAVAAAKWGIVAGVTSGIAGSAGGATAGSLVGSGSGIGGTQAGQATPGGPELHIHIDGVDPNNPRHQELIGETERQYIERYGGHLVVTSGGH